MLSQLNISYFIALLFRSLGSIALLPLGTDGIYSVGQKFMFSAIIAGLLYHTSAIEISLISYPFEFIIGVLVSLPCAMVIQGSALWGELFDTGRGQNIAQIYDPISQTSQSQISIVLKNYSWTILLFLGIFEEIIYSLFLSIKIFSPGTLFQSSFIQIGKDALRISTSTLAGAVTAFIWLSVIFLTVEILFGLIGKLLPNVSLTGESFLIKTTLAFLILSQLAGHGLNNSLFEISKPRLLTAEK